MVIASQACETKGWLGGNGMGGNAVKAWVLAAERADPIYMGRSGSINITDLVHYAKRNPRGCLFRRGCEMGVRSTDGDIYQRGGEVGRLWGGRGRNNFALIYSTLDFNIN